MNRRRSHLHRWGRRRLLSAGVLLVLAAGCTPPNLPAPLPPETTASAPAPPVAGGVISIGVDTGIRGFNPYVASQYSPTGGAISALVLPSVFTPGAATASDAPTALVDRVAVTSYDPFTVTYDLNRGAAWSDGTPIAAEDFTYLWNQMVNNTDVISPGGYQLIESIQSQDAGKTVVVVFSTPYADWRTLFSPLLPARTLKDEPGGFSAALSTGIPVAGSRYRLDGYDQVTGQITLVRNDKFWGAETTANSVVFRTGAPSDLVESLRRGDLQGVYLQPDRDTAAELAGLGDVVRTVEVPLPVSVNLAFNVAAGRAAAETAVRQAVAAALDTAALQSALTAANPSAALPAVSQLMLPAEPAAAGTTAPAGTTDDTDASAATLEEAGFSRVGLYFRRNGQPLTLTLGYRLGDDRTRATAYALQRQLGAAGILIDLVAQTDADFYLPLVNASVPDLTIGAVPRGPSDRAQAVSELDCAAAYPAGTGTVSTTTTSSTTVEPGVDQSCPPATATTLARYLAGGVDSSVVDSELWDRLNVLPLAEPLAVFAMGPGLDTVAVPGPTGSLLWSGPLSGVAEWATSN